MKLTKNSSTVFLVEDDESSCEIITHLLESVGLSVKAFKNPSVFLRDFDTSFEGCLVIDVRMPTMNGLDLYEELKKRHIAFPVIFMTAYPDISLAIRAMKAGAVDYIVKPFNNQIFLDKIQHALTLVPHSITIMQFQKRLELLTKREKEVLDCIIESKTNKEIAYELNITPSTVELHRANLLGKMQAKNLIELIKNYLMAKKVLLP